MGSRAELKKRLKNKYWRLNNLYWIIDQTGKKVKFRFNPAQEKLFDNFWYLNVLLKARQFGGTTFVDIYFLDECIFNPNVEAGIIAHTREDAQKIFRRKVRFPYENLPDGIKARRYPITDSRQELAFNNNSTIYVGTSMRSGTVQYLHISEFGTICRKYPDKAEEIKTGALNAVDAGQIIVIESTAEGAVGDFYEFCQLARANEGKKTLSQMDWKFHFVPWFENERYQLDPANIAINKEQIKYFNNIERACNIQLSPAQRAWYVKKQETLGHYMKKEYPSTPDEAFEGSKQMFAFSRDHHVIAPIPIPSGAPLYFTYDWGFGAPYSIGYWWVDADGRVYRFSEIYGQSKMAEEYGCNIGLRQTDEEVAETILEHEHGLASQYGLDFSNIIRLAGPDCFSKKPNYHGGGQGPSTAEIFATKYHIFLAPGDPTRDQKIRQFHQRLRLYDDMPPMMLIYDTCTEFIRTIPKLQSALNDPEYIDTRGESHCFDEACHILMARPIPLAPPRAKLSAHDKRLDRLSRPTYNEFEKEVLYETIATEHYLGQDGAEYGELDQYEDGNLNLRETVNLKNG